MKILTLEKLRRLAIIGKKRMQVRRLNVFLVTGLSSFLVIGVASVSRGFLSHREATVTLSALAQRPESGWLYVLDSNNGGEESQVLLLDPKVGRVAKTFRAGHAPEIALSPDGGKLYIISRLGSDVNHSLSVIDTAGGSVLQNVMCPDRAVYKVLPPAPNIAVSKDGRWVYIVRMRWTISPRQDEYTIATFDTERGIFMPDEVPILNCGTSHFLLSGDNLQLHVLCSLANSVYSLQLTPGGPMPTARMVQLPPKLRYDHTLLLTSDGRSPVHNYVAGGFFSADERTLTIITGHGRMFEMDIATQKILPKAPALSGRWVSWRGVTYSSDKTKLYLPVGQIATRHRVEGMTNEILVIDAKTLRQIRTITTSRPFWSLTISNDGQHLYAISPDEQCLLVIDTRTYQEVSKISNIGVAPAIAVVAP